MSLIVMVKPQTLTCQQLKMLSLFLNTLQHSTILLVFILPLRLFILSFFCCFLLLTHPLNVGVPQGSDFKPLLIYYLITSSTKKKKWRKTSSSPISLNKTYMLMILIFIFLLKLIYPSTYPIPSLGCLTFPKQTYWSPPIP